jgi:DNA-binding XRE family transcriptional regulator
MEMSKQTAMTDDGELEQSTAARFRALYEEQQLSVEELADRFGCSKQTIHKHLRECGILARIERVDGEAPPARFGIKDGYEVWSHGPHYVRVHRLLMVAEEGFAAVAQSEVVHHETEVEWDNRPGELRLIATRGKHNSLHGRPEVARDQQTLDAYPTQDEDQERSPRPERPDRQMTLTAFEETESAADDD